ncbi:hypothetical protein ZEAMMB73_Zm00001d040162 [Zea mays]|nr:hypothetical protein ZEAMMB73_Zm00001d040162 [Zea mays]
MREDYIQNAVKFLSHPKVKGSPVFHRRSFLEKKGLTSEEIDEAFCRVPDPKPNGTDAVAAGRQQANNPSQSVVLQPYTEVQPQAATASATAGPIVPHTKAQLSWVNTLLGAGLFLGLGASAAITLKKLVIPSLKSWTRRVVAEGDENAKSEHTSKLCEEIREAIKVSASAFSDIAKINQEVLASKDEGPIDYQGRAFQQTNMYATPPNNSFDTGRNSFMPLAAESSYGPFPGSYSEQRVQRPGGYGFQQQTSSDRLNVVGPRSSYQGGSSNHHAGSNAMDDPAAVAAELQRRWVPPQPPGVIMPEAAAAIRQARSVPRQLPSGDGRLGADVPRQPEPAIAMATTEHVNVAPEAPGGELPSDGGGAMTADASNGGGSGEQQEQEAS